MPNNAFHPYKAVAIDLDGTLLSHDLTVSEANRKALAELHEAGLHVILASGRHHVSMLPIAKNLPYVEWMVSAQGAFVSDLSLKTVLYDNHLPTAEAERIIDVGLSNDYSIVVYSRSGIFALNTSDWVDYYINLAGITPTYVDKASVLQESIFKVVLLDSEKRINAAHDLKAVRDWQLYKVRSLKNIFEFAGEGTSKAHGLGPLLAHLGIQPSELVAFGDAPNDIPMFEYAGWSYGMDTGWEDAKAAAHALSPPGDPASAFARCIEDLKTRQAIA